MRPKSLGLQALVLALLLAIGFGLVWAALGLWALQVVNRIVYSHSDYEYLMIRPDGEPLIASTRGYQGQGRQYRDLAGNPVEAVDESKWLSTAHLPAFYEAANSWGEPPWSERLRGFADNRRPTIYWFAVSDGRVPGHVHLVGYDSLSNMRVGFIGIAGFRQDEPPTEERFNLSWSPYVLNTRLASTQSSYEATNFTYLGHLRASPRAGEIPEWYVYLITDDHNLFKVDLAQRTARPVLSDLSVDSMSILYQYRDPPESGINRLVVRSGRNVVILDGDNKLLDQFVLPAALRDQGIIWGKTTSGDAVAYTVGPRDVLNPLARYDLYRISRSGDVKEHHAIELRRYAQPYLTYFRGLILPAPIATDAVVGIIRPKELLQIKRASSHAEAFGLALGEFWPSLVIAQLVGLAMAWLCYRRQMRYGIGGAGRVLWPLFVFICGLPGYVGYRFSRWWPALERCASCGRVVPQDRAVCRLCEAEFPMPEPKGTEVFA
jgi:hypothetical protein